MGINQKEIEALEKYLGVDLDDGDVLEVGRVFNLQIGEYEREFAVFDSGRRDLRVTELKYE